MLLLKYAHSWEDISCYSSDPRLRLRRENWTIHNFLPNSNPRTRFCPKFPPKRKYLPKKQCIFTKKMYILVVLRHNLPNLCPWSWEIPIPGHIFPHNPLLPGDIWGKELNGALSMPHQFLLSDPYWSALSVLIIIYGWFKPLWTYQSFRLKCCCSNTRTLGSIYADTAMVIFYA